MKDKKLIEGFLEDEELSLEERVGWYDIYIDRWPEASQDSRWASMNEGIYERTLQPGE